MAKPFDFGEPRFELCDLDWLAARPWPKNAKKHDLGFLGEAFKVNGMAEFPTVDEITVKLVAGHGRVKKLVAMRKAGERPPARVVVKDGKWLVWTIRGLRLPEPGKHVVASNMGVERGGWEHKLLLAAGKTFGDDLVGTGLTKEGLLRLAALARTGWKSDIASVLKSGAHMDAIPGEVVVSCRAADVKKVRRVVVDAVVRSRIKGVEVA